MITFRTFPAKLLLFGEYSVLAGSDACAFPWQGFSGTLEFADLDAHSDPVIRQSGTSLQNMLAYLESKEHRQPAGKILDMARLRQDIERGLIFRSDIPGNYGLGSSGALVAAIYDHYGRHHDHAGPDLHRIHLAMIESAFHVRSSGTDPLVSYLGRPVFIREGRVECPPVSLDTLIRHLRISLIDSGMPGMTKTGVASFEPGAPSGFFKSDYIPLVNSLVDHIFKSRFDGLFESVLRLSSLQLQLMPHLFTPGIRAEAERGLLSGAFAIKLCGSGGGGFYLKMEPAEG